MKAHLKVTQLLLGLLLGSLLTGSAFAAATYKWQDESGNTVYSQQPPPSGPYETIELKTSKGGTYSRPEATPPAKRPKPTFKPTPSSDTVQAEVAKNAQLRKTNCEAAKTKLEVYTVYRRMKDEQGNIVRIADDERERKIQEAKESIKEFCE
jgi:hypothetical protein